MSNETALPTWEKVAGFIFGVVLIAVLLVLAVFIPDPTAPQYATFKIILAVAAAGVGGVLAGFIHVEGTLAKLSVRAGGALALFVIVFFFSPAPPPPLNQVNQTIAAGGKWVLRTDPTKPHKSNTKNLSHEKRLLDSELFRKAFSKFLVTDNHEPVENGMYCRSGDWCKSGNCKGEIHELDAPGFCLSKDKECGWPGEEHGFLVGKRVSVAGLTMECVTDKAGRKVWLAR